MRWSSTETSVGKESFLNPLIRFFSVTHELTTAACSVVRDRPLSLWKRWRQQARSTLHWVVPCNYGCSPRSIDRINSEWFPYHRHWQLCLSSSFVSCSYLSTWSHASAYATNWCARHPVKSQDNHQSKDRNVSVRDRWWLIRTISARRMSR